MRSLLAAAALAAVAVAQPPPALKCIYDTGMGVSFDLTALSYVDGYRIRDNRNNSGTPFDYYVSVCNDMDPPAPACMNTTGDDGKWTTGRAPAFQVGPNFNGCWRLGDTAMNGTFQPMGGSRFRSNLAGGVRLMYTGGDMCVSPANASLLVPRSIVLDLECADTTGFFPMYDIVEEDVFCGYHAVIKTFAACPRECPRGGPSSVVCSNNGICGYDQTAGKAKCFCNKGWSGPDCLTQGDKGLPPPPSYAGNIAGGFFGGLFGGLAAAVGFFMVKSKMAGGSFMDGLSFGGGVGSSPYVRAASAPPSFTGASSTGYVAPDASAMAVNAPGEGPLLGGIDA